MQTSIRSAHLRILAPKIINLVYSNHFDKEILELDRGDLVKSVNVFEHDLHL